MAADPFRRPPMVDIPWGERERWWTRATRYLTEKSLWGEPETLAGLGELVAQFCEGRLDRTPDHGGPRDPETVSIAAPLAHANRRGFVTTGSQPGHDHREWEQRAAVEGWALPATVEKLRGLIAGTRLQMQVVTDRPRRSGYSDVVNVSRQHTPEGVWEHTHFGFTPGRREPFIDFGRSDLTEGAAYVTIYDPEWGDHSLLWDRLAQTDWGNPEPPESETPMPRADFPVPSDEQVDQMSVAVDEAFAERDRLGEVARRTGRDEDDAAMLRQDERAAALLDQYNANVAAQIAEVERRRAENLARFRAEQDEEWMLRPDAARSPLPLPPAAEPYAPPSSRASLLADGGHAEPDPVPSEAAVRDAERHADHLARTGAPAEEIDAADDETERLHQQLVRLTRDAERAEKAAADADDEWDSNPTPENAQASRDAGRRADEAWKRAGRPDCIPPTPKTTTPTTTPTTTGTRGAGMTASIGDARTGIMHGTDRASGALGPLQHARQAAEDALGIFSHASEGSDQADVSEAIGLLQKAAQDIDAASQTVQAAMQSAEAVATRL